MSDLNQWVTQQQVEYQRKRNAWNRASISPKHDADKVRIDANGSYIVWAEYGQTTTYGWEIDHELPKSQFPSLASQPVNLRALHWKNNRAKSDKIDPNTLRKILGVF